MTIEKVTDLDEAKVPGYFETIKSNFFVKILFLSLNTRESSISIPCVPQDVSQFLKTQFDGYQLFENALKLGNREIRDNFLEDIITSLIVDSWICFELIIKDLTKKDYSLDSNDISLDYRHKIFGLSSREKRDLDLFYYIRNAIVHYNGAYFSYRRIDHNYKGYRFNSVGHEGEKILIPSVVIAYSMHLDIENYAYKAWHNYFKTIKRRKAGH